MTEEGGSSSSKFDALAGLRQVTKPAPNRALQAVLEGVPGAWFFVRRDGTFAYVNGGACQGLGYTRDELLERTIFDIDVTLSHELFAMLWATTPAGESRTIRVRHRRKDGSVYPVEVRTSRMLLDAEDLAVCYTVDLTASEQTELINRRLLSAIEQASDAVVMTDAFGKVEYVNPAYEHTAGMCSAEVRGKPWSALEVREDDAFASGLARVLADAVAWKGRVQSRRGDGERYDEEVSASPIRDDQMQLVGCVAVKRDITEQLRMEQQLARAQKVEAVGQLARGIAHDFNNLLQVIGGHTRLIGHRHADGSLEPMLGEIERAVGRAAALVRQLLAFSRTGTIERSALRVDALVSALHEMLGRLLGEDIELDWRCTAGPVWVRGNAPQLEQVIVNLCINARDAMPRGGRLTLRLELTGAGALPAAASAKLAGESVVLTVSDEGEGMSEEVQSRLFEPFFTTKPPGRGSGLGLPTVHAVVQDHEGCIDVSTRPGQGSTFRVFLPVVEPGTLQPIQARARPRVDGRGRLALVVEDEPAVRELTMRYLESVGFRVLTARDGVEAEEVLAGSDTKPSISRPDLAVLDAVMPRRGGQALYQLMRERGLDCPVVFVTGYDFESLAATANQERVAILQKPFSEDELLSRVADVLDEHA
jgi:two-component system, cell cycle sensor histidine kinase and response regulator CckA